MSSDEEYSTEALAKYQAAADVSNRAVAEVAKQCLIDAKLVDLINLGNKIIEQELSTVYQSKDIEKGIAFPTNLSINNVVCHYCVMQSETKLKDSDLVKIDLGCHIDGYIAQTSQTIIVKSNSEEVITGRQAEVIEAARKAFEVAGRLIRPGNSIADVSPALQKVVADYNCNLLEGVLSHQIKRYVIDGNKCILSKTTPVNRVDNDTFEENEIYAIDIAVSTGQGKSKLLDEKETTIYKRALDVEYNLRLNASRVIFKEINKRFPTMPFTMSSLKNQRLAKFGLVECLKHGLLHPYPVLYEKPNELVSRIKHTVLITADNSVVFTENNPIFSPQVVDCELEVKDEEIIKLLKNDFRRAN